MALTMIDPASSWFEIIELPLVKRQRAITVNGKELLQSEEIFDNDMSPEFTVTGVTIVTL